MAVRSGDFAGDLNINLNLNFTWPLGYVKLAGDLNLISTWLGSGRFWSIYLGRRTCAIASLSVVGLA